MFVLLKYAPIPGGKLAGLLSKTVFDVYFIHVFADRAFQALVFKPRKFNAVGVHAFNACVYGGFRVRIRNNCFEIKGVYK